MKTSPLESAWTIRRRGGRLTNTGKQEDGDTNESWSRHSLLRFVGRDLALLVGGILIAFSLDAAWDGAVERRADERQLQAVADEFREISAALDGRVSTYQQRFGDLEAVAAMIAERRLGEWDEWAPSIRRLNWAGTLEVQNGALSVLLNGGGLSRIRNAELRVALGNWPALVQDAAEGTVWLREHRDEVLRPLVTEYVTWVDVGRDSDSALFEVNPGGLFRDRRFADAIGYRMQVMRTSIQELEALRASADGIVDLIEG